LKKTAVIAALFWLGSPSLKAAPQPARVLLAPYAGVISPVSAEFIVSAIRRAESEKYQALVLELDTPGGLDASMRQIVQAILSSKVPVVVYIYPAGARAASAGVFITMAAHVAAMAPSTNIGAAHPVLLGGAEIPQAGRENEKPPSILEGKMVNDASAYLKSIARERGRNEDWAARAVTESISVPANEAVKLKVVDLEAPSLEELLKLVDGRPAQGFDHPLRTAGAEVDRIEMSRRQRILAALSDPNVAMILMSTGAAGILIELYNPGLILPGIVGVISLIFAFYSFQTLSANYAGVLLILVGMLLFLLEIKVTSYGLLALGGVAAIVLGSLVLFSGQASTGLYVAWQVLASAIAGMLGVTALCSYLVYKAYHRKTVTGVEAMIGRRGRVVVALSPKGKVQIQGELWDAESVRGEIAIGADVTVESLDGLTLLVR
jgi:membrane-bound serine protease (ClpP class)